MVMLPSLDQYHRHEMSPSTLALAVAFATGDMQRPLPEFSDVDWNAVFQAVCRNGILGITYYYLAQRQTSPYPPEEFQNNITSVYRLEALRMAQIHGYVRRVLEQLNVSGIDYLVVKGPVLAYSWYPNPMTRTFNDLDIVIRERDWSTMHQFMLAQGYAQKEDMPVPPPKLVPQAVYYESKYVHRDTGFRVEVHYDDILNAGIAARDIDGFWQRAIPVDVGGIRSKTLSVEDQLIHLCAHVHFHGYTRLNWFTDLALIMQNSQHQIDWDRLLAVAEVEEAQVPVYYSLHFLEKLMNISPRTDVMERLRPDFTRRHLHEFYMPQHKILSFQPMQRPDFSFGILPLHKRLLPDLLVMGRRREKLGYLARLIVPPQAWLKYYYQIENPVLLLLYHILHPLKLLGHYSYETLRVIISRTYVEY